MSLPRAVALSAHHGNSLWDPVGTTERPQCGAALGERELRWVSGHRLRAGAGRGVSRAQGWQDPRSCAGTGALHRN